jgi:hypothetical protein
MMVAAACSIVTVTLMVPADHPLPMALFITQAGYWLKIYLKKPLWYFTTNTLSPIVGRDVASSFRLQIQPHP